MAFDELIQVFERYAPAFSLLLRDLEAADREAAAPAVAPMAPRDDFGGIA
jgi:hypothetical protein